MRVNENWKFGCGNNGGGTFFIMGGVSSRCMSKKGPPEENGEGLGPCAPPGSSTPLLPNIYEILPNSLPNYK